MKVLLWALLLAALVFWVLRMRERRNTAREAEDAQAPGAAEPMVRCAHCGVHLPLSESIGGETGNKYCSTEHRRLAGER